MALAPILIVLFVLLSGLGSWRVWRRSPAYSLRITLQIFGICAGILALSLLVAVAPLPEQAHAALAIGSLLLCVLGAPALIVRITNGRVAALPPSVQLLSVHRLKVQHWIWRLLTFVAVCAGSALVLKGDLIWVPITLGGFVALCAGAALIALYMRAARLDRGLSVVLDKPWIHWRYSPEEWRAWVGKTAPADTYIGEEGIYSAGEFTLWSLAGGYLIEAITEGGPPPHIRFVFQTNMIETKKVLIPAGHEADLVLLQQKLRAKIPNARLAVAMPFPSEQTA